jgi:hypothetical protein
LVFSPDGLGFYILYLYHIFKKMVLGFAATCNIGGSGKWRDSDTRDLEGAKVVIVPDRDEPGINHAEGVHQHFPGALWLYPFPNSKAWQNLPKSKGLDIADWIEQHQITADD